MPDVMRLVAGGNTVTFSPILNPDYQQPDDIDRVIWDAEDGTRYWSDYGTIEDHRLSLNALSTTDSTQLNTWWQGRTLLTFTPDLTGAPSTTIFVRIMNERRPFQMRFGTGWDNKFEGRVDLHEVSSSSSGA